MPTLSARNTHALSENIPFCRLNTAAAALATMLATIQHKEYFRASKLGEGSFGSVITVYDEDGGEFACKVFDQCEEEGEEDEDGEWEEGGGSSGLDVGVLRELSILRLLNGAHPNIMRMVDVSNIEDQARGCGSAP